MKQQAMTQQDIKQHNLTGEAGSKDLVHQDAFAPWRALLLQQLADKALFEQARKAAYAYLDEQTSRRVSPDAAALEALSQFDEPMPSGPAPAEALIDQLHAIGSPATIAQATSGRYFGLVNGGVLPVALAARWLADAWDQNAALYLSSPIASKLEQLCQDWLCQLMELPQGSVAGFVSGSSTAILCGLAAGRYRLLERLGWDINRQGLAGAPRLRLIAGQHAHATVLKAVALLGLGTDNIEWVPVDEQGRIRADQLPKLDATCLLMLQAGNVNSGAFDDFATIMPKARAAGAWVHIDGAFGLWAKASSPLRALCDGIEQAQSFSLDGHKTLNTPYDNGIVLCSDANALRAAFAASGSYILYSQERDGMAFTPEMSRRARAVELWAALKFLGRSGLDDLVTGLHQRALQLEQGLRAAGFEICNQVAFNQVLVGLANDDDIPALIAALQADGRIWVGGGTWFQRPVVRVSVCSWATSPQIIEETRAAFIRAREGLTQQT